MIDGLHFVPIRRAGKPVRWYVYAWRGGPCIMKAISPAKPKLTAAALKALSEAQEKANEGSRAGTLAGLSGEWQSNEEWKRLAPSTKQTWGLALAAIERKWGETPLAFWNEPRMVGKIVAWRDSRADTPRAADIGVTVLSQLLEFGRLRAKVTVNLAAGIPQIYRGADRAEIIWTDADVEAFSVAALQINRPHAIDGLWLASLTGMRRADLVGLTWSEINDSAIVRVARKKSKGRRRRAVVPLIDETRDLLAELRTRHRADGVDTVLVNSKGQPWTPASFTQAFNEVRDLAGIAHVSEEGEVRAKHLHDARGTFVTKLCRCGLTNEEIARTVAWSTDNVEHIRRTYVDDAAVVVALSERINRRL